MESTKLVLTSRRAEQGYSAIGLLVVVALMITPTIRERSPASADRFEERSGLH